MAGLGGFGALFDLKAAGYDDPVLVAATDGVGTKLRIAIDTGNVDTSASTLSRCASTTWSARGRSRLFFLDYFATGKLEVDAAARIVEGIAEGCRLSGCALIGGRDGGDAGDVRGGRFRPCRVRRGRDGTGRGAAGGRGGGRCAARARLGRGAFQRLFAGARDRGAGGAGLGRARALRRRDAGRGAADADAALRAAALAAVRRAACMRWPISPAAG
jgi:hypothetical protein